MDSSCLMIHIQLNVHWFCKDLADHHHTITTWIYSVIHCKWNNQQLHTYLNLMTNHNFLITRFTYYFIYFLFCSHSHEAWINIITYRVQLSTVLHYAITCVRWEMNNFLVKITKQLWFISWMSQIIISILYVWSLLLTNCHEFDLWIWFMHFFLLFYRFFLNGILSDFLTNLSFFLTNNISSLILISWFNCKIKTFFRGWRNVW